ncbi:MAG: cyclic nucleotide-binding domain-containing protein [Actinomycetota bacterium]|nr:cyclic nucleotide-binding domain-containing protein [Actinomycetota bacterium]
MEAARLKSIPLFAQLSQRELEQIAQWADEVEVPAGKHLVDQGQFAYEFFVIEEGTARVSRDGAEVADLGPGDFFGEIALLSTERRTASVLATSPMRLIVMFSRDFRRMTADLPKVGEQIRRAIEERMSGS